MTTQNNKPQPQNGKPSAAVPMSMAGFPFTVPVAGLTDTIRVDNKFGKKARVKSIFVEENVSGVYISLSKTGGGEPILDKVSVGSLYQKFPVPLLFEGGDWKVVFTNTNSASVNVNLTLWIEYA